MSSGDSDKSHNSHQVKTQNSLVFDNNQLISDEKEESTDEKQVIRTEKGKGKVGEEGEMAETKPFILSVSTTEATQSVE